MAHIVAANYKSLVKKDPEKAHFKSEDGKKTKYNVSVYHPQHFPILQMCFNKILEDN